MSDAPVTADFGLVEEAMQLDEIIITGTPAGTQRRALGNAVSSPAPVGRASSTDWRPVGRAAAEAEVGFAMLAVPELALLGIEVNGADGGIRVVQALGPREVLTLVERRGEPLPADGAAPSGMRSASTRVAGVTVTAIASLPADSLRSLLERLR
jgi:hypothetical protein